MTAFLIACHLFLLISFIFKSCMLIHLLYYSAALLSPLWFFMGTGLELNYVSIRLNHYFKEQNSPDSDNSVNSFWLSDLVKTHIYQPEQIRVKHTETNENGSGAAWLCGSSYT